MFSVSLIIGVVAAVLVGIGQVSYLIRTKTSTIKPSVLSWLGWSALMGTSAVSQFINEGWEWSLTGLVLSASGCAIIGSYSLIIGKYSLQRRDWLFLLAGVFCIFLYLKTDDAWLTTVYAISADFLIGIPTLIKGFQDPKSERSLAWSLGIVSWTLSLSICIGLEFIYWLFPIYLWSFCFVMVILTHRKK